MADLGKNLKSIWMKGMEAIGNTASNIASNTKYKVDEMNLLNRRREILSDFGAKAYAIWQKGEFADFPESLKRDLEELTRLDNQLVDMRAEHFGGEDAVDSENKLDAEAAEPAKEFTEDDESLSACSEIPEEGQDEAVPVIEVEKDKCESEAETKTDDSPEPMPADSSSEIPESLEEINHQASSITEAINDLFDQIPSVDSMANKMNDTLDQMGNNLKKFSEDLDAHIQDLNDKLNGSGDEPPKAP